MGFIMAKKKLKIESLAYGPVSVYFDSDLGEYSVKVAGNPKATYFTDDKKDALSTAQYMRNNIELTSSGKIKKNPVTSGNNLKNYVIKIGTKYYNGRAGEGWTGPLKDAFRYTETGAYRTIQGAAFRIHKATVVRIDDIKENPVNKLYPYYFIIFNGGSQSRTFNTKKAADNFLKNSESRGNVVKVSSANKAEVIGEINDKKNPIIPGILSKNTLRVKSGKGKFSVQYSKKNNNDWNTAGTFPNRGLATDYCKNMHENNSNLFWRVVEH